MRRLITLLLCISLIMLPVHADSSEKLVALTFDDGPSGRFTRRLLEGLEERNVRATFFLCGYRIEQYPNLTETIFENGHEIGVHGYSHKAMKSMCPTQIAQEIRQTLSLLPNGCTPIFLRPPGGLCGDCVQSSAEEFGLALLHWSVDPKDWEVKDAKAVALRVIRYVKDGDVVLLHDMSDSSVDAALMIIDTLQKQGFRFVTASELAQKRQHSLVIGRIYTRFSQQSQDEK